MSKIPGHRVHSAESKKSTPNPRINGSKRPSPPSDAFERYTMLQRKVDDLEKVHNDGKKAHQAEVERFKLELTRLQKANAELTDRLDKQRKQKESLDLRVDELKKNSNADKAEIKDLGVKLRMSEHQRTQMTAKHGNVADVKKSLQSLETRRKEELKESDRTIANLEKSLLTDKKKREIVESNLKETKAKHDVEIDKMKDTVEKLKTEIVAARDEVQQIQHRLETTISKTSSNEESMLAQLEDHKLMLNEVAELYGLLASNTVPRLAFERLTFENYALRIQAARSLRKLGNTEGQVSELANLIRQSQEENQILRRNSKDMMQELSSFIENATSKPPSPPSYDDLDEIITHLDRDHEAFQEEEARVNIETLQLEAELHHLQHDALFFAYAEAETELHEALAIASKLPEVEQQRDTAQELLQATNITAESLRLSSDKFKLQVAELEEKLKTETRKSDETLQKEKDNAHRLTTTVQKLRMAEDGLRAENEQLTYELSEAERFQEAYYSLSEELEGLLDRNALAEDEAQRLSRVNAEIIGHHNPLQRIMYLEKIRNELAETKQKLLVSMRTNETVAIRNHDLQNELDMYKSVAVPYELKPGTMFTRMARPPLVNLNKSNPHNLEVTRTPASKVHNSIPGDMDVDELS
ncbi:hypothetical protein F5876DRAFT_73223 [Lentinula aff. lateritia]|uniref:Uncharacterized protein n=1 Tax=Lentinula aff. lateritia TaxID=2804960 RepID=A0ACC1UAK4_9AGAR|nr:hypothetical protein F5876DRAFT_73223 [Lentinula aff. lateritia]